MCREITKESVLYLRDELRSARTIALRDAEGYQNVLFALERLGAFLYLRNGHGSLKKYGKCIKKLAESSHLAKEPTILQSSFEQLYDLVKKARNDALHQGAFARHLTESAVQVALILEDALAQRGKFMYVRDLMVKSPVCAALWQPISFIRQQMLLNSFSYMPFWDESCAKWKVVSDYEIAKYLTSVNKVERLKKQLKEAIKENLQVEKEIEVVCSDQKIENIIKKSNGKLMLVCHEEQSHTLLGIITPFDML